ncbi:hypothetical protein AC578_1711 [Pseudocercospora eumusae]|uniref:Haloacid dehalogenase-like hydrolase n=1 Tax=Pseudocercospora eumusae TaxID=321146 RepID=A0A139GWD2_9PEZI|nr:hypothetical protein AC578_1711 [Pseudocercospora eumusae]KXS94481.1 hypothetical protein AC578_1711 [Pseudocercospora eumusae]
MNAPTSQKHCLFTHVKNPRKLLSIRLCKAHREAVTCYAMAQRKLKRPTRLILDYDGTLTVKDTMAVLGSLPKHTKISWQYIVDAYMKDHATYMDTPYPWKNYDRQEYSGWLAARKWVEQNSAQRVQAAAFFRGVTTEDVEQAVAKCLDNGELQLRREWKELFELFLPSYDAGDGTFLDSSVEILSVNWSETAIRQALFQSAQGSGGDHNQQLCHYINDINIFANEIEGLASPYGSSGRVVKPLDADIRTSGDKLRYLDVPAPSAAGEHFTVYVGDSSTDFDALCAADLGIWLCDVAEADYEKASMKTFKPLKFIPPPLHSVSATEGFPALFYWAPDLRSVIDTLSDT